MDVTVNGDQPGWLLHQAAIYNNIDLMKSLLEGPERNSVNAQDSYGRTPLYTSVIHNSLDCCELLLDSGADVNLPCGGQLGVMTPLHIAALKNNLPVVKLLLDHGADLHKKDASGKRAIELAETNRSVESVDAIRGKMEKDKAQKDRLQQEFIEACLRGDVDDAKRIAMDPGYTLHEVVQIVNGFRSDQLDLLYRACDQGNEAMCEFLLQNGARVVPNNKTGQNSFHVSCLFGHVGCARLLLQQYPDLVNIATYEGSLPIHLACLLGQVDIIRLLLAHSAHRVLEQTSSVDHVSDSVTLMINARDAFGQTPLHVATSNRHLSLVEYLLNQRLVVGSRELAHEAESEVEDNSSQTSCNDSNQAEDETPKNGAAEELELRFTVDVDADDLEGMTPFHLAVMGDGKLAYYDIVDILLRHKADPNRPIRTLSGVTPALMEAVQRSDPVLLDLLLSHGARDEQLRVLKTAIMLRDDESVSRIIQHRTYLDSEFKVGHKHLIEQLKQKNLPLDLECLTNISEPFAVMVCWHGLALQKIALAWLQLACEHQLRRVRSFTDEIREAQSFCCLFITRVDISNNHLSLLPSFLFSLPNLRILNASFNQIRAITKVYSSGTLDRESSTSLPVDFQLDDFDDDIDTDCPLLEDINLQKNQLFVLPTAIFKLPSLKRLNASDNQICSLPFAMWMNPSLVDLNLSNNRLDSLPCYPDNADSRTENGYSPRLTPACGMEPGNSPAIVWEPDSAGVVELLNASTASEEPVDRRQEYTVIPTTYINCWQERVQVELAPVSSQMDEKKSEQHSQLKELNLSGNQLEEPPHGLPCLVPRLEKLSLAGNRLTQMGHPEMYPSSLKSLDLSQNQITNETSVGKTTAISIKDCLSPGTRSSNTCYSPFQSKSVLPLMTLSASNPMLRRLSSSAFSSSSPSLTSLTSHLSPRHCPHRLHRHFVRLKSLKMDNNRLTRFIVRVETTMGAEGNMRHGSPVDGSQSPVTTSYDYPLSRMPSTNTDKKKKMKPEKVERRDTELLYPNLILLDLSNNEIESLPSDICDLVQLAELKISCNRIKELPPEMGVMRKLWYLDFAGCPVEATLRSLLGEKATRTMTIISYLKSIREEAKPFNRMKLMFVGKQGIGKTSLLSQLRYYAGDRNKFTHWAQRMGHEMKDKDLKGENISTVGVDIGTFEIQRGNDKVVFSTWDFGGQREYYATHQYFLSKRSLYLVIWRVTDGEEGVGEILHWLINIQARAPNSPVIIVGTHRDALRKSFPRTYLENLGELIERKYIQVTDPDKLGLPRVMGHIEVSCKGGLMSRTYVSQLVDMIWKVANEEQQPGNPGSRLLDQLVPASYLHLQDVVVKVAEERKLERKDPVLYGGQYKHLVIGKMEEMFGVSFQDISELNQATQFLHENGILLHYDDISLRDIYFLDPQWLCDMLANVITIREINGLVRSGLMMADDLKLLFKGISFRSQDIKSYIVDLLQKFEVALLWNETSLIIPSLLPTDRDLASGVLGLQRGVVIPVQGFVTTALRKSTLANLGSLDVVNSKDSNSLKASQTLTADDNWSAMPISPVAATSSPEGIVEPDGSFIFVTNIFNPAISVLRLYVMSYFPSGFWPRLITRLLGDSRFSDMLLSLYDFSRLPLSTEKMLSMVGMAPCWTCWQTGALLQMLDVTVLQIKEVSDHSPGLFDYPRYSLMMKSEEDIDWSKINTGGMSFLEILIPNETLEIEVPAGQLDQVEGQRFIIYPNCQVVASLLSKIVDCVDLLLEDWYPDIGIRFTQNTRGMYLITRLVPCTRCFLQHSNALQNGRNETRRASETTSPISQEGRLEWTLPLAAERVGRTKRNTHLHGVVDRGHVEDGLRSYSCDRELKRSSKERPRSGDCRKASQSHVIAPEERSHLSWNVHCYTVEQCLQIAQLNRIVFCPKHGNLGPFFVASDAGLVFSGHVAPDTVFQDIGDDLLVDRDSIILQKFLGKGAFGAVFSGTIVRKSTSEVVPVALKMLQPIKPLSDATYSQQQLYQIEKARWDKEPLKNCCEAYLNARKELGILLTLRHEYMVPLVGVSVSPLCLVLSLAPLGALGDFLRIYQSAGARLPVPVIHQIILQVSSALQYLHSHQVIYRDLKSDNILVWSLPPPHSSDQSHPVDVKLADYGVSRLVQPFGMKGFAGTLAFMAPEIIRHGGDETYTEKVDCFSFGMFIYELLLLRAPYDDTGSPGAGTNVNIKGHVLAGGRPKITNKEVSLPSNVLDLMTLCWSPEPADRPSSAEIGLFARSVEFSALCNAVMLDEDQLDVICCCSASRTATSSGIKTDESLNVDFGLNVPARAQCDVWMSSQGHSSGSLLVCTYEEHECIESKRIDFDFAGDVTCMCVTKTDVWCACTKARLHIFRRFDYSHVMSFSASSNGPSNVIKCMSYGELEDKVYVCFDTGQFVVYSDVKDIDSLPTINDYPGNEEPVCCMTALPTVRSEVWCGQSCGRIQVWRFRVGAVCVQTLVHEGLGADLSSTSLLVPSLSELDVLWSCIIPGLIVYRWSIKNRCQTGKVDVSHVPYSIPDVMHQVQSLSAIGSYLYVSSSSGFIVIFNAKSFDFVNICHAHECPVSAILPLSFPSSSEVKQTVSRNLRPENAKPSSTSCLFVTIAKGYRDLVRTVIERYQKERNNLCKRVFLLTWSGENWSETLCTESDHPLQR